MIPSYPARPSQARQGREGKARAEQGWAGQSRAEQTRPGQAGRARPDQARPGETRPGQVGCISTLVHSAAPHKRSDERPVLRAREGSIVITGDGVRRLLASDLYDSYIMGVSNLTPAGPATTLSSWT